MKSAIVLCSGGLDSVVVAHQVRKKLKYIRLIVLFFNYGQKSLRKERVCSKKCAKDLRATFKEIRLVELGRLSTSLINKKGEANKVKRNELKDTRSEGLNWYVPFRNTVFLSYAFSLAESIYVRGKKKYDIFVGFKSEDQGGYPDTSLKFVKAMEKIGKFGHENFKIKAPMINKDKSEVVQLGNKLGVCFENTFSCYIGKKKHCGYCLACRLRQEGFYWANIKDSTKYKIKMKDFRLAE